MVDHTSKGMTSLAIDNAQQTTQHHDAVDWSEMDYEELVRRTNGSRVRKLFFKNGRSHQRKRSLRVNENSQSISTSRMAMANEFYKKQCHV